MSERPRADVLERVRKLLIQTEDGGCTPAEAEAAMRLASRIMAEHNLDMAEVSAGGSAGGESEAWEEGEAFETGRWSLEDNCAYGIAREFFFVEGYFKRVLANGKSRKVLVFFGHPSNVEAGTWAFKALREAFDRLFGEHRKATRCHASERRIFVSGVADGFRSKMRDERRATEIERDLVQGRSSGSTALALVGIAEETERAYKQAHSDLKKSKTNFSSLRGAQSTLDAGIEAGRRLNLNRQVGKAGAGPRAITGS